MVSVLHNYEASNSGSYLILEQSVWSSCRETVSSSHLERRNKTTSVPTVCSSRRSKNLELDQHSKLKKGATLTSLSPTSSDSQHVYRAMIPTLSYHVILKAQNQRQHSFFIHCSASPKLTRSWQGPSCSKHLRGHLTPRSVVYSQLKRDSTTCFLKCPLPQAVPNHTSSHLASSTDLQTFSIPFPVTKLLE